MALCELVLAEKPGLDKNLSPRDWQLNTQGIFMEHKLNQQTTSIYFFELVKTLNQTLSIWLGIEFRQPTSKTVCRV